MLLYVCSALLYVRMYLAYNLRFKLVLVCESLRLFLCNVMETSLVKKDVNLVDMQVH